MRTSFDQAKRQLEARVRQLVDLNTPDKSGTSKRAHLQSAIKQLKKAGSSTAAIEAELEPVKLHPGTQYLLMTFDELSSARQYGMGGPLPISYLEIKAYCELMGEQLSPWEIECIRLMDGAYIEESARQIAKE